MVQQRVLMVLPESPYPPRAGNALRDAQHVSVLASLGWQPILALAATRRDVAHEVQHMQGHGVTCLSGELPRHERRSRWATAGLKLAYIAGSTRNPFAWWLDHADLNAFVLRAVTEARADTIVLRSLFIHTIPAIRRTFPGRVIVDCHDADEHLARELIGTVRGARKVGPWANWRGMRRAMCRYLPEADEVWAVSDEDRRRITDLVPGARVITVRSGLQSLPCPRVQPGDGRTVLLVANYAYGPNWQGALWLIREVWPHVIARCPHARLVLAGSGAPPQLRRDAEEVPGVEFRGFVEDLAPLYGEAAIVAVPVAAGSGTRLKAVDAWRHGKAVVSTPKGIEGLPAAASCALIGHDAGGFATAVVRLLRDVALRRELGSRALCVFQRFLSLDAIADALCSDWRLPTVAEARDEVRSALSHAR